MSDEHIGKFERVRDAHGYHAGWTVTCSCGWASPELRETQGNAAGDLLHHAIHPEEASADGA